MVAIEYLANVQDCIPSMASWLYAEFERNNPQATLQSWIERLERRLVPGRIPITFVARVENGVLGSTSLVQYDMDMRKDLEPWVSAVFVRPEFRRLGVGTRLVRRVEQEAHALGYERLFLYTPDMQAFYASFGWLHLEELSYRGRAVTIMQKELIGRAGK